MVSSQSPTTTKREFDPRRWAHATFGLAGLIFAWLGINLVLDLWDVARAIWPEYIIRPSASIAQGAGVTIGLIASIALWRSKRSFDFISEVAVEVSQVIWPNRAETKLATMVVVMFTLVSAGLLLGMDNVWQTVTNWIYDF
jgi:preprotein translocase SecE subunit